MWRYKPQTNNRPPLGMTCRTGIIGDTKQEETSQSQISYQMKKNKLSNKSGTNLQPHASPVIQSNSDGNLTESTGN